MLDQAKRRLHRRQAGFSMIEIMMAMLIGLILTAAALPSVRSGVNTYRLNSAVAMAKWGLQSTRFQALEKGYWYQLVVTAATNSYKTQYSTDKGTTWTDVAGSTTPLSAWPMTISADTTIRFQPNGYVSAPVGGYSFTISYQAATATITVSNYGNVTTGCTSAGGSTIINPTC
jgi:prepilin-type N-terminal cleavage/methylation domain-containing protein